MTYTVVTGIQDWLVPSVCILLLGTVFGINGVWIGLGVAPFFSIVLANKPFAMAPGMGLNSFFAIVVGNLAAMTGMTYVASFQAALVIILLEGIVFLILSVLNVREKIVQAIPLGVRLGISPAIGLMLIGMPVSGSIGHAIGIGLISYTVMKIIGGKAKEVSVLTYAISALFLVKFFVIV